MRERTMRHAYGFAGRRAGRGEERRCRAERGAFPPRWTDKDFPTQQKEESMRRQQQPHERPEGWHGRGQRGRGRHGEGRDRARRGEARYILLDALRDGPKHGYEIIKALEERSAGQYTPSPGTVYPTLQYLEDEGLVRAAQEAERRVYQLTEAGQAELTAHAEQVTAFWAHFAPKRTSEASQHEVGFLEDELAQLNRTIWQGLRAAMQQGDQETIRRVRAAVEQCQNEIRGIISGTP